MITTESGRTPSKRSLSGFVKDLVASTSWSGWVYLQDTIHTWGGNGNDNKCLVRMKLTGQQDKKTAGPMEKKQCASNNHFKQTIMQMKEENSEKPTITN